MSDVAAPETSSARFDDRLDTQTRITNLEMVGILWRSLKLVAAARALFLSKIGLGFIALIPGLYLSWLAKIVIDQVLLQQPFDQTEVPFPPHVAPFVDAIADLSPMGIMAAAKVVRRSSGPMSYIRIHQDRNAEQAGIALHAIFQTRA